VSEPDGDADMINACSREIEGVQCGGDEKGPRGCGAVWLRHPHQKRVADWGWCPECGNWSTWDVDLEWLLFTGAEAQCKAAAL
jgi:hypothetical protein